MEYLVSLNPQPSLREICLQVDQPATFLEVQKMHLCKVQVEAIQISQRYLKLERFPFSQPHIQSIFHLDRSVVQKGCTADDNMTTYAKSLLLSKF